MTQGQDGTAIAGHFEVAVAFAPAAEVRVVGPGGGPPLAEDAGIPGTKEAAGDLRFWQRQEGQQRPTLVEKGEEVTRPSDAVALMKLKQRLDEETSFMLMEPDERDTSIQALARDTR
jgi:hypothetical protein